MSRKRLTLLALIASCLALAQCLHESPEGTGRPEREGPDTSGARYAVTGWLTTNDQWIGYVALTKDLSPGTAIDLDEVVEFPDDMVVASPGDGKVFVGDGGKPSVYRLGLDRDGKLAKEDSVSFAHLGLKNGMGNGRNPIHFVSADKAFFVDGKALKAVVWNPRTMETVASFDLPGLARDGLWLNTTFIHRDGDRLILAARYYREDDTAEKLAAAALIDVNTYQVRYIEDDRCGNIAFQAVDSEGNLYLSSHTGQAASLAAGAAGTPASPSCILRINRGAEDFDPGYFVDLGAISGGHAGGLMDGKGDGAFVLVYEGGPLDADTYGKATAKALWRLHSLTLGREAETLAKVEGMDLLAGYGLAFTTEIDGAEVPFVVGVKADFSEGTYYDVSEPSAPARALTSPGWPGNAILLKK